MWTHANKYAQPAEMNPYNFQVLIKATWHHCSAKSTALEALFHFVRPLVINFTAAFCSSVVQLYSN